MIGTVNLGVSHPHKADSTLEEVVGDYERSGQYWQEPRRVPSLRRPSNTTRRSPIARSLGPVDWAQEGPDVIPQSDEPLVKNGCLHLAVVVQNFGTPSGTTVCSDKGQP